MRKKTIIFSLLFSMFLIIVSCESYEDDYSTSFLPAKVRLQNTWKRTEISGTVNGTYYYSSATYPQATLYLEKYNVGTEKITNYDASYNIVEVIDTIEWKLDDTRENFCIRYKNSFGAWDDWLYFKILKLTEGEFWVQITNPQETVTYKFEK